MSDWHIGVLGGSGLYEGIALEDSQEIEVASPFGAPSGPVTTGRARTAGGDVRVTFLARHGAGHRLSPDSVNYRANIDVLKRCGVTDLLAISAIGSLREEMAPGQMVAVDQFIDRTCSRPASFFGEGLVAHAGLADPVCARLSALAADAVEAAGGAVHRSGTYVAIEGPQFSTRAESRMYRAWGGDVIGMTGMPEARLAREAELPYAMLGMVTDYDSWRDTEAGVEAHDIMATLAANADLARATLAALLQGLPAMREASAVDTAMEHALITSPERRDTNLVVRLDAVAGRLLG
ncbi:S-methyl-5'-thioadenosine phosphorylase [Erythrobacteraceae bacterium WH01K]|nr:S-methyl-5'-thioadenosine phosphorylase [Erythrobacteraceae bacterium WH01K]